MKTATALLLAGLALGACVSSSNLRPSDGTRLEVRDRTYAEVYNAAVLAVSSAGAIDYESKAEGIVRGFRGASGFSTGEAMAIFISPPRPGAAVYDVRVAHRSFSPFQVGGSDWERTMVSHMRARLDL